MNTECPLCKNNEIDLLYTISSEKAARHFKNLTDIPTDKFKKIIENLWKSKASNINKCNKCNLVFSSPFVAGDNNFYSLFYDNFDNYPFWKWDFEETFDKLKKLNLKDNSQIRILEIGSGNGVFLNKLAKEVASNEQIFCTESSEYCIKELRRKGFNNVYTDLSKIMENSEGIKFDAIFMFQVLEHLDQLDYLLNQIIDCLSFCGDIFITVPNNYQRELYERMKIYEDIPPMHLSRWSLKSFQTLANNNNLNIIDYKIEPQKYFSKLFRLAFFLSKQCNNRFIYFKIKNKIFVKLIRTLYIVYKFIINIKTIFLLHRKIYGTSSLVHLRKLNE